MKLNYINVVRLTQGQVWICINNRAKTKTPGLLIPDLMVIFHCTSVSFLQALSYLVVKLFVLN